MIALLLALHPRAWRARYGEEFRALLETEPLTARVVLDVLIGAVRQQVRAHRVLVRVAVALVLSVGVEWVAVSGGFTDNILWPPSTGPRAMLLGALVLPWVLVAVSMSDTSRRRLHDQPPAA